MGLIGQLVLYDQYKCLLVSAFVAIIVLYLLWSKQNLQVQLESTKQQLETLGLEFDQSRARFLKVEVKQQKFIKTTQYSERFE